MMDYAKQLHLLQCRPEWGTIKEAPRIVRQYVLGHVHKSDYALMWACI